MNYILHSMAAHHQLATLPARPHHVSLYWALFFVWNAARFPARLPLDRPALMVAAHIGNRGTYLDALRDLDSWGLLTYLPSHHGGSAVRLRVLGEVVPEVGQPAAGCTSSGATQTAGVGPQVVQPVVAEAVQPSLAVAPEMVQPSLVSKTVVDKHSPKQGGGPKKKESQVFAGDGLSTVEVLPKDPSTNDSAEPPRMPRRKPPGAPKKPGVGGATIREAATRAAADPTTRRGRPQRPEVPFAESELARYEDFAAVFAGTDYELADLRFYHAQVANWRKDGEPPRRRDWKATATKFMLNDAHDNRLKLAPGIRQHADGTLHAGYDSGIPTVGYRSPRYD